VFSAITFRAAGAYLALVSVAWGAGGYADPVLCAKCHAKIAETYGKTGMGRSFSRASAASMPSALTISYYHAPSDTHYAMIERAGSWFQRRWQVGFDGSETNIEEKRVDYVLGSGNHGQAYLHLTPRNTLQQLPLGWYSEKGGEWAMNPGYDRPDYPGSLRAIPYQCMFCHNGYPEIPKGHEEAGAEPQFSAVPEGIDCQRCHGPGQKHVETAGRTPVVNPARLSPERELEVCLQCHLETTSRSLPGALIRKGRGPFSYAPGQPLADFRLAFDRATPNADNFEVAHAGYRFLQSQCYLKSAGKLRCTTCHNPHDIPHGEEAEAHYNEVCRGCHQPMLTNAAASGPHTARGDCVACHMPKRRTDDAVHIVVTDHRIQRRAPVGDLLAEKAETRETQATAYRGEVVPFYPAKLAPSARNSLDGAVAQIRDGAGLKEGLPRLARLVALGHPEYCEELADGYRAVGDLPHALTYFEEAARHAPSSSIVLLKLGNTLMELGQFTAAEKALRQAVALDPADPLSQGLLGWVLAQENRVAEGREALEKAIRLDPELPDMHNYLGALSMGQRDAMAAEREFRAALTLEPGIAEWQANLAGLLASLGKIPEAGYHFRQSVHLQPEDATFRLKYARFLFNTSDDGGAVREYTEALRLQPGLSQAEYELGLILWQTGNSAAATPHLKAAAESKDAQVRSAARELLGKITP
jgi:predicted CXXCH cytochrome family protein